MPRNDVNVKFNNLKIKHYEGKLDSEFHCYPFGIHHQMTATGKANGKTPFTLLNSQHLERGEFGHCKGLNLYNYEARMYVMQIGRWGIVDPLAKQFAAWSTYNFVMNNPINLIDPDGRAPAPPSTHIDQSGNVIAEYSDDGDDGVYVHSNGTTQSQIDQQRTDNKNTAGTGTHIGEIGGEINANSIYTNTLINNTSEAGGVYNPFTFKDYVKTGGKWDLKSNKNTIYDLANDGKTQFSFNGNLMESQDIGNHHFGAVALSYWLFPSETFILKQAGAYQIKSGTSKPEWQIYKNVRQENFTKTGRLY